MRWQSELAGVSGVRIHYHRTGGDKPALVLLHGITDNGLAWTRVAQALEDAYDCLLVDARGHGLSDKPSDGYASDDHAADVAGLIERLGLGPVLLMGHSLGAISAAALVANRPELARGLVLEDPPWRDASGPAAQTPAQLLAWMSEWRASLVAQQRLGVDEIAAAGRRASPRWHPDEFPTWAESKRQVNPDVLTLTRLRAWNDLVPKLACPTLLVSGDPAQGAIVTPALAQRIVAANPRVRHLQLPGAGHNVRREAFESFVSAVRGFLAGVP